MAHDFKQFPELTTSQMDKYYFQSPHKQIMDNFTATVVKVHDGDTITLRWEQRNFDFPLRFADLAAPELNEAGGVASQSWLEARLLGKKVEIVINPKLRVEKWGRLLGKVLLGGLDIGEESIMRGHAVAWEDRKQSTIPDFNKELDKIWQTF